jgi:DNA mismatch repair protein MutH
VPASDAVPPPTSEAELQDRAQRLAGRRLSDLAALVGLTVPGEMRRAKGFAGSLLERCLGATAGSRALPDFEALGVELKTLPVDASGRPLESTFVCTLETGDLDALEWETSRVRHKLARVLWVPILSERERPLGERVVGTAFLWSPSPEEDADLRWDFEELLGLIARGRVDDVKGSMGRYLQVRPKAQNARSRRLGFDEEGLRREVLPRGFYLRPSFTGRLLAEFLAASSTRRRAAR